MNFIRENVRRASKESITIMKPRRNKREKSLGGFKRKIVSD